MDFRQIKAIENSNKKRLLKFFPNLSDECGIYILTRFENGFKYAYVGQAKKILTRLANHLKGYQHIDLSLKKHGFYSDDNPTGWNILAIKCNEIELNEKEQFFVKECAKAGYQLRNKTAGGQGDGKVVIAETRPAKGYYDGLAQGEKKLIKEIQNLFDKYLVFSVKKENKLSQRAYEKFQNLLMKFDNKEMKESYKGFDAVYYKDYLSMDGHEECFYNIEIFKDKKCLRHATLGGKLNKKQVLAYLKDFVESQMN